MNKEEITLKDFIFKRKERQFTSDWTTAQFIETVKFLSNYLLEKNIERVCLKFTDTARFTASIFACLAAGCEIYLPNNLTVKTREFLSERGVFWISDDVKTADFYFSAEIEKIESTKDLANFEDKARIFVFTSGTTGESNIVAKTWSQTALEAEFIAEKMQKYRARTAISSIIPEHLYGLSFRVFAAFLLDWIFTRTRYLYPNELLLAANCPSLCLSSPAVLNRFDFDLSDELKEKIKNIQVFFTAGGKIAPTVVNKLRDFGTEVIDIYGSTETGLISFREDNDEYQMFEEVQIETAENSTFITTPWAGRMQIGDCLDISQGKFRILGRADRVIKIAEKRYSLDEIEHFLLENNLISDIALCLKNNRERLFAAIALSAEGIEFLRNYGRKSLILQIKNYMQEQFDALAIPRYFRFVRNLARGNTHKISRKTIDKLYQDGEKIEFIRADNIDGKAAEITFRARVPLDLPYFAGHFASFPLVPGAVEVLWIEDLIKQFDWGRRKILRIENLKFAHFVRPDDELCITLNYDADKDKAYFAISVLDKTCTSGRICFS
ncbi:MAG: AMP-binding protein [Cardiobacteriaceae bacterium]|nr:AMP-binding protein [Cardiobacteriaceae bacterium]